MSRNLARNEFLGGVKAELPILVGVVPFGLIYGILALDAGLSAVQAQAMSMIVFAGSAQFLMAQLFALGTPAPDFSLPEPATGKVVSRRDFDASPAMLVMFTAFGALRGIQDMRSPLWIAVVVNALNILLDALVILGFGPIPALGIAGAAAARPGSSLEQALGAALVGLLGGDLLLDATRFGFELGQVLLQLLDAQELDLKDKG